MNELIQRQHIQKRSRPFRHSPALKLPSEKIRPMPKRRRFRSATIAYSGLLEKTLASVRSRVSSRSALAAALVLAAVSALAVFGSVLAAERSVRGVFGESDPLLQRDMRSYVGLSPAAAPKDESDLPPLDLAETFKFEKYTVRTGESVSSIAAKHSLTLSSVIASNGISNVKRLKAGTVLKIPNMDGLPYTVRKGDSLSRIAASYGIPMEAILDANDLSTESIRPGMNLFLPGARLRGDELRRALGDLFIYPVRGRLTSGYGWRNDPFTGVRRFHAAVDLAAPTGTPLFAAMDGRVSSLGYNSVYGKYVILSHSGGYQTLYAHLNEYRTERGARVNQGTRIGDVGSTGYSTGSHLHFAVFKNGRALNPLTLLSGR